MLFDGIQNVISFCPTTSALECINVTKGQKTNIAKPTSGATTMSENQYIQ